MAPVPSRNLGFGLVEVVVSVGMIIIVLTAVVFVTNLAMRNSVESAQEATAYGLGTAQIEILRNERDRKITSGESPVLPPPATISTEETLNNIVYTISTTVEKQSPNQVTNPGLKENYRKITATASWRGRTGLHQAILITYLTSGVQVTGTTP